MAPRHGNGNGVYVSNPGGLYTGTNHTITTKQVNGDTFVVKKQPKVNVGQALLLEAIDMIAISGVAEMALAQKAVLAGRKLAQIKDAVQLYRNIQALGNDVAKTSQSVSKTEKAINIALEAGDKVVSKGGEVINKVVDTANKNLPKTTEAILKYGTEENATIAYKVYDKTKTGLDLYDKVEPKNPNYIYPSEAQGNTQGNTSLNTQGNTPQNTQGNAHQNTQGNAHQNTQGNTTINTQGNTTKNTQGNAHQNTQGNAHQNTQGNTTINTQGNTTTSTQNIKRKSTNSGLKQRKPIHNWIDKRNYNQFIFHDETPTINNDWLSVNQNYKDNIDGEKLQNYISNE